MRKDELLLRSLREGNVGQAYILCGEDEAALSALCSLSAAVLLCEGSGKKPCGNCPACALLAANSHPDVHYLVPEQDRKLIGVPVIRDYIHSLSKETARGGWRVGIMENAHNMTAQAQNAFLKTLEEPPPKTAFFLTGIPHGLLPTVRSRCFMLNIPVEAPRTDESALTKKRAKEALSLMIKNKEPPRELFPKGRDELDRFFTAMGQVLEEEVKDGRVGYAAFAVSASALTDARKSVLLKTNQGLVTDRLTTAVMAAFKRYGQRP